MTLLPRALTYRRTPSQYWYQPLHPPIKEKFAIDEIPVAFWETQTELLVAEMGDRPTVDVETKMTEGPGVESTCAAYACRKSLER